MRLPGWIDGELVVEGFDRITQTPGLMGARAGIRGMRVTVSMILGRIAAGCGIDDILMEFPYLEREDIPPTAGYAAWRAEERDVELAAP